MPLDDRLRAGLTRDEAYRPPHQDEILADLVPRAARRRRVRGLAIGAAAAAVLLVVAAAVPWALRVSRSDDPVVVNPTTTEQTNVIDDWRPPARTSSVDGDTWRTGLISRSDRLAALEGTGLEGLGPLVYTRASMRQTFSEAEFVQSNFTGKVQAHGRSLAALPAGTFRVVGPRVVITFAEGGGRAVFRWNKPADNTLELEFVSTTAPEMYGAPAEVFLRMWSAARFVNP
jgi:hypothetical protein